MIAENNAPKAQTIKIIIIADCFFIKENCSFIITTVCIYMPTIEKPLMKCDIINYLYSWLSTKFQIPKILKTNEMSYVNFLPYLSYK